MECAGSGVEVPSNNHLGNVARSIRDMTTALQHRYLHTPLQPVRDKQFVAIKALEKHFCPDHPAKTTPAPIQPILEQPRATIPPQQIQPSTLVDLSPPSQEHLENNPDRHRYLTRFSLSKKTYSMACTSKYFYAAGHLAQTPAHPIHFHEHMACPVINLDTGAYLEYRHLVQVPDKDIWVK